MGGGGTAKAGNNIAQASLDESRRQYEEQQAKEAAQKAKAKANAAGVRTSDMQSYGNTFASSNILAGNDAAKYSLLSTSAGTPSVLGNMMGAIDENQMSSTLGG